MPDVLIAAIARTADVAVLEKTLEQCVGLEAGRITLFGMGARLALDAPAADAGANYLKNLGIPHDAANYYDIAVSEGRTVVTYVASEENATLVTEQFRACGFVKIRRFLPAERVAGAVV